MKKRSGIAHFIGWALYRNKRYAISRLERAGVVAYFAWLAWMLIRHYW